MDKIENLYGTVFEGILGEKISTKPVEVVTRSRGWIAKAGQPSADPPLRAPLFGRDCLLVDS